MVAGVTSRSLAGAATNRDLESDVRAKRFREDPFFRLNVVGIALPPLRERASDIPVLAERLLAALSVRHRRTGVELAADVRSLLAAYRWPGNVRELVNVLERAVVLSQGRLIRTDDLPDRLLAPADAVPAGELSLEQLERRHIQQVLADAATLEEAAARLGINVTTLWRKRKRYLIEAAHGLHSALKRATSELPQRIPYPLSGRAPLAGRALHVSVVDSQLCHDLYWAAAAE